VWAPEILFRKEFLIVSEKYALVFQVEGLWVRVFPPGSFRWPLFDAKDFSYRSFVNAVLLRNNKGTDVTGVDLVNKEMEK
jgi:hypothetical protein